MRGYNKMALLLILLLGPSFSAEAARGDREREAKIVGTVSLDFLSWIHRDATWLRQTMEQKGRLKGQFTLTNKLLQARTLAALRRAKRIFTFSTLAAPGLRPPFFDLSVKRPDGSVVRCVTLFPRSIAPKIKAEDFDRAFFSERDADHAILARCIVQPGAAPYRGLSRDNFRRKFFDRAGDLKLAFNRYDSDPGFIAQAIDHGFSVQRQCYSGRLRISQQ